MKQKKNKKKTSVLKKIFTVIIIFSSMIYLFFGILRWPVYNYLLDQYSIKTVAIISTEKSYKGKGVITEMYTYLYTFSIDDKKFEGDSSKKNVSIGSEIEIEYFKFFPGINRPIKSK